MKFSIVLLPLFMIALAVTKFESVSAEDEITVEGSEDSWEEFIEEFKEEIEKYKKFKNWLKDRFDNKKLDLKEKYARLEEYAKKQLGDNLEKLKSHSEKVKVIAEDYRKHNKELQEDLRKEGYEFLKQYKEELGGLWDEVKNAFEDAKKDIQKKEKE